MRKLFSPLAICMLTWQVASAQLMGNILSPSPNRSHSDIANYEGDGFKAEYYNGSNFEQKAFTRVDKIIDFYLSNRSPDPRLHPHRFSIRWTGKLYAPQTGRYTFIFAVDDGVRLWVNNTLIIDRWGLHPPTRFYGKVSLTAKQVYDLRIEYSQMMPSQAVAKATWIVDDQPEELINYRYVYSSAGKLPPVAAGVKPEPVPAATPSSEKVASRTPEKQPAPVTKEPLPRVSAAPDQPRKKNPATPATRQAESKPAVKKPEPAVVRTGPENAPQAKEVPKETFENLEAGKSIVLNHIFFDQSKHELRPESSVELDKLVNTLRKYAGVKITITGHTDNVGDFNLNVQLSKNRAKAVADYLIAQGISHERIEHKGFGAMYPVAPNSTEENRMKNRRVEFTVR
jgi:outer membrane protein OmpA-like peptidoglycan-associated protein